MPKTKTVRKQRVAPAPPAPVDPPAVDPTNWLTLTEASRLVNRTDYALLKLAAGGHIRTHYLPGLPSRYSREDCLKYRLGTTPNR